jgi:hypothetical protein
MVFLVNLDNARMQGGAVREIRPVGPFDVVVRLAPGESAHRVRLMRDDHPCAWQQVGPDLVVTVPSIEDFEVVAVHVG